MFITTSDLNKVSINYPRLNDLSHKILDYIITPSDQEAT